MNKKELRNHLKNNPLSVEYIQNASKLIQQKIIDTEEFRNSRKIFCYVSVSKEVSTSEILSEALISKKVYVPKCLDRKEMKAARIHSLDNLVTGKYSIPEPADVEETEYEFDLIIVPCICAGKNGERMGHGAGFYDRFLSHSKGKTLCLCFEERIIDDIEMNSHDVFMDEVITEESVYAKAI